jgi:microcystin-dependent protein
MRKLAAGCVVALVMAWSSSAVLASGPFDTGLAGGGQAHENTQPSLGVTMGIAVVGLYPNGGGSLPSGEQVLGSIQMFGSNFVPRGYVPADGRLLPIAQNTALFSLLGTTYGGDGETTFAVPDLRGRTPVHAGSGPGLPNVTMGQKLGSATHTLSINEMPSHTHGSANPIISVAPTGGSQAHNNQQASLGVDFRINTDGTFPTDGGNSGTGFVGQVGMYAGNFGLDPGGTLATDGQLLAPLFDGGAMFSILGTRFGGNGETNFGLPDLRGRAAIGAGQGAGLTNQPLGNSASDATITLNTTQMPRHQHDLTEPFAGQKTTNTGGGQAHSNMMPTTALNYIIAVTGIFPSFGASAAEFSGTSDGALSIGEPFLGEISMFAGDFAPGGWLFCHGQILPIAQNQSLFSLLGTTYGGDGETTFALPDFRGRVPVGLNSQALPDVYQVNWGERLGSETHTLSLGELPRHSHQFIPEPTSLALVGLGGLALLRRRS